MLFSQQKNAGVEIILVLYFLQKVFVKFKYLKKNYFKTFFVQSKIWSLGSLDTHWLARINDVIALDERSNYKKDTTCINSSYQNHVVLAMHMQEFPRNTIFKQLS